MTYDQLSEIWEIIQCVTLDIEELNGDLGHWLPALRLASEIIGEELTEMEREI